MGGNDEGRKRKTEKSSYSLLLLPDEIPLASAPRGVLICLKPLRVIMVIVCVYVRRLMFAYGVRHN